MANKKITQMTELAATPASGDKVPLVDVDDTTGAATGTTKWVSVDNLISEIAVADMTASAVVTESEGISSNDNDTTLPTSAAVKDYVDGKTHLALGTTSSTALAGDTTTISPGQASAITANTAKATNATHTGEVTGSGALTIADDVIREVNLEVNVPDDDDVLTADASADGGFKWAAASGGSGGGNLTTKGDLEAYTTSQTRLAVGDDDYVLTADASAASGVAWKVATGDSTFSVQRFTGNGVATDFTLSEAPVSEDNTQVYVTGVYQQKNTYGVSGTTLAFDDPPADTADIEVVTISTSSIGTTTANLVTFSPTGTGATDRTTQAKLRDWVSVRDFGATGNGSTDDSGAIQAACDAAILAGGAVYVPSGIYKCTSAISVDKSSGFFFRMFGEYGSRASEVDPADPTGAIGSVIWFSGITSGNCFSIGDGTGEAMAPVLEDLLFLGNADNGVTPVSSNTTTGLKLNKARNAILKNVNIRGFFCGLQTTSSWSISLNDVNINRCHIGTRLTLAANVVKFDHCTWTDTTYGVLHEEGSAVEFLNCWWQGQGSTAQRYMKSAVVVGGSGSIQINSINFANCYFEELRDEAVQLGYQNDSADGVAVSLSNSTNSVRHVVLGGGHWDSIGLDQSGAKVKISTKVNGPVNVTSPLGNFDETSWVQFTGDATTISSYVAAAYGGVSGPDGAYETGTWSPVVSDAESGGTAATMSSTDFTFGRYTKIGNRVFIDGSIRISSTTGMTTSNTAYVTGLPITPSLTGHALIGLATCRAQYINTTGDGDAIMGSIRSTSTINFHIPVDSGTDTELTVADISDVNANHFLTFFGQYVIA